MTAGEKEEEGNEVETSARRILITAIRQIEANGLEKVRDSQRWSFTL
jgi:hypothetical protein